MTPPRTLPAFAPVRKRASKLVTEAIELRARHRRHKLPDRYEEIRLMVARINAQQRELKPYIFASVYRPSEAGAAARKLSEQLQRERRKLRKMLNAS